MKRKRSKSTEPKKTDLKDVLVSPKRQVKKKRYWKPDWREVFSKEEVLEAIEAVEATTKVLIKFIIFYM